MDLKTKNDNYQYNPTSVVKTLNQLGRKQTLNLVKKVCLKPVLCSKLSQFPPGMTGSSDSKRHVNRKFGSVTGFGTDRKFTTPHISGSRLSHEASRSCKSGCVLSCCNSCSFCSYHRASAKESPVPVLSKIKHVNSVSCVVPCLFVQNVQGVPTVVHDGPVGGRLQKFWQVWQRLGANPRAVSILKEGYSLPFKLRPPLTRVPIIQSSYANPVKSRFLKEALISLQGKLVVEPVLVWSSLAFYNRLFLVPKPENKWRPILDLSWLNKFLRN